MSLQIQLKKSAVSQKQPFASDLAVGELALNYNAAGPFLTCKDSAGNVRKLNNVWVSNSAPTGPSAGDLWLDTSATIAVLKVYKDATATWVDAITVPIATTSIFGKVQLASAADITNATAGKVVDAAQLQSKITAELSANPLTLQGVNVVNDVTIGGDLTVNGTQTVINTQTLDVEDKNIVIGNVTTPSDATADGGGISLLGATTKTINWVDATDSWTSSENVDLASGKSYRINGTEVLSATALGSAVQISSANIPNGTIVDSDINDSAEIAVSKLADGAARQLLQTDAAGTGVEWTDNVDVPGTLDVTGAATFDSSVAVIGALTKSGNDVVTVGDTGTVTSTMIADGTIVDADVNASAAIAGTKISPDFGAQNVTTTGTSTAASFIPTSSTVPTNGVYLPSANSVALSTNGTGRVFIDASGNVGVNKSPAVTIDSASTGSNCTLALNRTDAAVAGQLQISAGNNANSILGTGTKDIFFSTNALERLRITSAGLVGIGTSVPGYALTVTATSPTYDRVAQFNSNTANSFLGFGTSGGSGQNQAEIGVALADLVFNTQNQERLRIDTLGRVGIGTSNPQAQLDVAATNPTLRLTSTFNGNPTVGDSLAALDFYSSDTSGAGPGVNCFVRAVYEDTFGADVGIAFGTTSNNGTGTEKLRIDNQGRLLVGTSSNIGSQNIQVGTAQGTLGLYKFANNDDGAELTLANSRNASVGSQTIVNNNDFLGRVFFRGSDGSGFIRGAEIACQVDGTPGTNDMPGRLVFSTTADGASSPTERMRIGSTGQQFNFASNVSTLTLNNSATSGLAVANIVARYGATGVTGGINSFIVWTNGNVVNTNNSYGALSDIKLKENIVDAGSQWSDIKALQVRKYNFKEGQTHTQIGLVAQEVELVSPGLVSESPDRDAEGNDLGTVTKSVNYSVLYMKAVKALQEAMERIETLEAKVAALESA